MGEILGLGLSTARMSRALVAGCAALLCIAPVASLPVAAQNAVAIHITTIPTDTGMEAYYARELGFFTANGVDATVDALPGGSAITAGVVSGSIDIGFANLLPVAQANARGIPLVIVFPGGIHLAARPDGALMVPKDSSIRTARDLNGKTIGIPSLQNMTQLAPMAWIDQNGGDSKSVHWVEIGLPLLGQALDAHRVDAIIATEPYLTADLTTDRILADPFNAIASRFVTNCWFASKAWADAHPDAIARFVRSIHAAAVWANTHPRQTDPIIAKYTKTPEDVVARTPPLPYSESVVSKDLQPLLDSAAKYGMLARPIAAEDILYHAPGSAKKRERTSSCRPVLRQTPAASSSSTE